MQKSSEQKLQVWIVKVTFMGLSDGLGRGFEIVGYGSLMASPQSPRNSDPRESGLVLGISFDGCHF